MSVLHHKMSSCTRYAHMRDMHVNAVCVFPKSEWCLVLLQMALADGAHFQWCEGELPYISYFIDALGTDWPDFQASGYSTKRNAIGRNLWGSPNAHCHKNTSSTLMLNAPEVNAPDVTDSGQGLNERGAGSGTCVRPFSGQQKISSPSRLLLFLWYSRYSHDRSSRSTFLLQRLLIKLHLPVISSDRMSFGLHCASEHLT